MGKICGVGNLDERYIPAVVPPPPPPFPDSTKPIEDKDLKGIVISSNSSGDTYQHTPVLTTSTYNQNTKY
jgi:hypothetical protein